MGPAVPDNVRGESPDTEIGRTSGIGRIFSGHQRRRRHVVDRMLLLGLPLRDGHPRLLSSCHAKGKSKVKAKTKSRSTNSEKSLNFNIKEGS